MVRFHKEVSAEIPVTVVAEGGAAPVAEAPAEAPVAAPVEEDIDETEAPVEE